MATTTYIQGGARYEGVKTKTRLKELLKTDPSSVVLYATSSMGPQFSDTADKLPQDVEFNVVGPDPYTKRDWYATVKYGTRGALVCV